MEEKFKFSDLLLLVGSGIVLIVAFYFDKWALESLRPTSAILLIPPVHLVMVGGLIILWNITAEKPLNAESTSESYGGAPFGSITDETTRFLCASAVILGEAFRIQVLTHLRGKHRAVAPEVGLNVKTIAHVCSFMEKREFKFRKWFAALGIVSILLVPVSSLGPILPALGASVLWFYKKHEERFILTEYFTKERFGSREFWRKFRVELDNETVNGIPKDNQNLLIYEGFSPFVGTGIDFGGWSFAIDVSKPNGQVDAPMPFNILELYDALESSSKTLQFPSLLVKDFLFVHGTMIRHDESILPDPFGYPLQSLAPDVIKQYIANSDYRIRHYKWFRVHDWGNEMVFSLFLRCSLRGSNLFIEVSRFLLPPLASQYHQIDTLSAKNWQELLGIGIASLVAGPLASLIALFILSAYGSNGPGREQGFEERRTRREIQNNPLYNYGAANSLRQTMCSARYLNYFQRLDQQMYVKVLDREILDTIVAFLDDHNVDTSDLKSQQTTILNSGILVQGGNVEAQSVAVGAGSQAVTSLQPNESAKSPKKE